MKLHNHVGPSLSELDQEVISHIPPGGNWKDVPESVPSKRLQTIRESYARGEGSRSTYYGRLTEAAPSYTINTYFSRPGNGCHIHYAQPRTLSPREAARFQSFPDRFAFEGPKTAVAKQIGNAVPPVLAYQVVSHATQEEGGVVDLFAGAGGLSLGAVWAGWEPILGNDVEERFLNTYRRNVHDSVLLGDIRSDSIKEGIIQSVRDWREQNPGKPVMVLGGPPCQGFSTAGKKRSMNDERNHLFKDYASLLQSISPDHFLFENVTGLLNMHGGRVLAMVRETLEKCSTTLDHYVLQSEQYGVPQRRTRVFLLGDVPVRSAPDRVSAFPAEEAGEMCLPVAPGALSAIGDLPPLTASQDGTDLDYRHPPMDIYQRLMRDDVSPAGYLDALRSADPPQTNEPQLFELRG